MGRQPESEAKQRGSEPPERKPMDEEIEHRLLWVNARNIADLGFY